MDGIAFQRIHRERSRDAYDALSIHHQIVAINDAVFLNIHGLDDGFKFALLLRNFADHSNRGIKTAGRFQNKIFRFNFSLI